MVLPLTIRGNDGLLYSAADPRYRIRDSAGAIVRPFPPTGSDFTELTTGIYQTQISAPLMPGSYLVEYIATVDGVLMSGDPDLIAVAPATQPVGVVS